MSKIVGIIQARMGSKRLPGKMLMPLGGKPIVEWVVSRVLRAKLLDRVILATSNTKADDALSKKAINLGIQVFRGNEFDVLKRFVGSLCKLSPDSVVRICGDNAFIDPVEIDRLITSYNAANVDYACNHQNRLGSGYADGFGAEIIDHKVLERINDIAVMDKYREHVTLYLWCNAEKYSLLPITAPPELKFPNMRFDVNTIDDFNYLAKLVKAGVSINSSAAEIVKIARSTRESSSMLKKSIQNIDDN